MKKDIVLCGVGGQGILTVAVLAVSAAVKQGLNFRQSEVHGMSQRGGAVECHVRISDKDIHGDLVGRGRADCIISVEPLEALRQIEYLAKDGVIITNTEPFKNIPDYPPQERILELYKNSGARHILVDAAALARQAGNARAQNVVMAGAAAKYLGLGEQAMLDAVTVMFAPKGAGVVELNLKAFEIGLKAASAVAAG